MDFGEKLEKYAELIVKVGVNVQKDQLVTVTGNLEHRTLMQLIARKSYEVGAKLVIYDYYDEYIDRYRYEYCNKEQMEYVTPWAEARVKGLCDEHSARIFIDGSENPTLFEDCDAEKMSIESKAWHRKGGGEYYSREGIDKKKVQWCVVAGATSMWAERVIKNPGDEDPTMLLWEEIFKGCRLLNQENFLKEWEEHYTKLAKRAKFLTDLKIKNLNFKGPSTDLNVGLSEKAVFGGGPEKSIGGHIHVPNIPTEEVYTTPDWRTVNGNVRVTRPVMINGKLVKGLNLIFKDGDIVSWSADDNADAFENEINQDEFAKRLGEVALVGIDSPIYQSGRVFEEILFDENAACHIAIGEPYRDRLDGGPDMSEEEAKKIGCNGSSSVHTDMMISDEKTQVIAHTYDGKEVTLIKDGKWVNL